MSNIRYAVLIIGALSLLLGLSLGQIYFQHQKIEQLEFNRFRNSATFPNMHHRDHHSHDLPRIIDSQIEGMERAKAKALREKERALRHQAEQVERRLQKAIRRYNKELELWESNTKWKSTKNGLYRVEK